MKNPDILLTDTVGFIQKLPTNLVAAFRATLEEITEADILLVSSYAFVDAQNPYNYCFSLSQYLLILIKDLDYFSGRENIHNNKLNKNKTNIEEVLKFCEDVTKGIIKKYGKENKIRFSVL